MKRNDGLCTGSALEEEDAGEDTSGERRKREPERRPPTEEPKKSSVKDTTTREEVPEGCELRHVPGGMWLNQDVEHFQGRDLPARTMPEEKEIWRDTALSPTNGIIKQENPEGERNAGQERHREAVQGSKEEEEESPREHVKSTAPTQKKETAKQPSHVPRGAWLHKDAEHFRGRDLWVRTTPEEKEIERDAAVSPMNWIIEQEDPEGERDAGQERHREAVQGSKEEEEELQRNHVKSPAPPQKKDTAKQPSHVPGGAWLHKGNPQEDR
ncbi:hypothetical protein NDU88_002392 [Pleurodeles waltl]|uniref:Uncharacterized protein n=1 Tax=Pleurodeles waltl TaxID=8319 RepID=A0AAV7TKE0_PLEWA|nr:hypothetical protein NDU88_002392 [Pleurodeles waltl]